LIPRTRLLQANRDAFNKRLEAKLAEWDNLMKPFHGTKVVTYHKSFDYFIDHFGLELPETSSRNPASSRHLRTSARSFRG